MTHVQPVASSNAYSSSSSQTTSTANGRQWTCLKWLWTKNWVLEGDSSASVALKSALLAIPHFIGALYLTLPALFCDVCKLCDSESGEADSVNQATKDA